MTMTHPEDHLISLLYVEDDAVSRRKLSKIIRHRYPDIELYVAVNGESGIETYKRYRPEIVITDINMPISDGIQMATEIKTMKPSTEIIALTAYTNAQYLLQAIAIGISHYILKPVEVEKIFNIIDKTLATISSERVIARQNNVIRELNGMLAQKAAELELANQELMSFNYTVAHDLRSPMITISEYSQRLIDSSLLDNVSLGLLQTINREIIRVSDLIGVLLNFSVNSRKHVKKKWTNLSEIASEIRDNLRAQDSRRHVNITIKEGINGYCDPTLLRIVLENLLGNSWKYSAKKDDVQIEFGTINREDDLVYFVRDNGAGFDQQESGKLFSPFQRLHCDDEIEGLGIGLATTHRIIQRHGGTIWADGVKGEGATFYFTL